VIHKISVLSRDEALGAAPERLILHYKVQEQSVKVFPRGKGL
jgi:hypothetical protein